MLLSLLLQTVRFLIVTGSSSERVYTEQTAGDGEMELLQREVDALYRQSREVRDESALNEIMHSVGYSRKGEQVFIFPRDISPDITAVSCTSGTRAHYMGAPLYSYG